MTQVKCRYCYISLITSGQQMGCPQCRACFIQFSFFQKYLQPRQFEKFWQEAKKQKNFSKNTCLQCNARMGLYILNRKNQIEYCTPCQRVWIEKNDLEKLTEEKGNSSTADTAITDTLIGLSPNSDSPGIFAARFEPQLAFKLQLAEWITNKVAHRITETSLFKKYPVFTFALVVAIAITIARCHNR